MRKINVNFEVTSFLIKKSSNDLIKIISKNIHFLKNTKSNYFNNNILSSYKSKNIFSLIKIQLRNFSEKESLKLDPYLILEVNRGADFKTIKTSYFKLARLYHPDTNKNDEVNKKFNNK
jgi:DnaJ-class molecular chaperone